MDNERTELEQALGRAIIFAQGRQYVTRGDVHMSTFENDGFIVTAQDGQGKRVRLSSDQISMFMLMGPDNEP